MDKVKEMYRLFKKHGLELEGLRSFGRYVSDEEMARKRALADDLRRHPEKLEVLIAQGARSETSDKGGPSPLAGRSGLWATAGVGLIATMTGLLLWRQRRR
jgi:hypothetical protein